MKANNGNSNKQWAKYREEMCSAFPSAFSDDNDPLSKSIAKAIEHLNKLRPNDGGPAYLGQNPALTIDFDKVKDIKMADELAP